MQRLVCAAYIIQSSSFVTTNYIVKYAPCHELLLLLIFLGIVWRRLSEGRG